MLSSLKKASLVTSQGEGDKIEVKFLYNPSKITYKKSVRWNTSRRPTLDKGDQDFAGGDPAEFSLSDVLFDTTLPELGWGTGSGNDVRDYTDKLLKLVKVNEFKDDTGKTKLRRTPKCRFEWGNFISFEVYVTSVSLNFDLFNGSGVPLRAWASISFMQASEDSELKRQNPTSGSYARKIWTVLEGETLDWIAYQEYGDAAAWRHIAEVNNLNNPLSLRPGQLLKLTPLE